MDWARIPLAFRVSLRTGLRVTFFLLERCNNKVWGYGIAWSGKGIESTSGHIQRLYDM